jgi:hypothetical protein
MRLAIKELFAMLVVLSLGFFFTGNVMANEQPKFTLIEKSGEFELRRYEPMIVAETRVQGSLDEASSAGFRLIAGYIFGGNKKRADTAPEKIAMTAPVNIEGNSGKWRVEFVMPSVYSMATLPIPNDTSVKLREIPEQTSAVIVFSGFTVEEKVNNNTAALQKWMKARGLQADSVPRLARYNPPWTLPFMRRNEILINYRSNTGQ